MPFGLWARMGLKNHVLNRGPEPLWEGQFLGKGASNCKLYIIGHSTVICAKNAAEPIEMLFRVWAQTCPRNHVLDGSTGAEGRCHGNQFWGLSTGYNFGCMIASDTLFDSRGGFSGSSYPMKT